MTSRKQSGFTLVELLVVIGISFVLAGMAAVSYVPLMKQQHVTEAYNTVLGTLRRAHDQAAGDMRVYVVTVTAPSTITVQQSLSTNWQCQIPPTGPVLVTATLPTDITFHVEPGVPTSATTAPVTPDQFGTASFAADLDQNTPGTNTVCFNPDGSATDQQGNISNGVIYFGRPGDLYSSSAITLWGSTGRLRGWRLYNISSVNTWSQQ